jgi:elongation factor P
MQANDLRKGTSIIYKNEIYVVMEYTHYTPGNKRAFVQATLKELKSGKIITNKFSSTENVEAAHLDARKAQYLYHDQEGYHFMDLEDYHTFALTEAMVGHDKYYLKENDELSINFYNGSAVTLEIPKQVVLKVTDSPPWVRGDSVSNNLKPATCETGLKLQVPIFLEQGSLIRVDTRTGEYIGRE